MCPTETRPAQQMGQRRLQQQHAALVDDFDDAPIFDDRRSPLGDDAFDDGSPLGDDAFDDGSPLDG